MSNTLLPYTIVTIIQTATTTGLTVLLHCELDNVQPVIQPEFRIHFIWTTRHQSKLIQFGKNVLWMIMVYFLHKRRSQLLYAYVIIRMPVYIA